METGWQLYISSLKASTLDLNEEYRCIEDSPPANITCVTGLTTLVLAQWWLWASYNLVIGCGIYN